MTGLQKTSKEEFGLYLYDVIIGDDATPKGNRFHIGGHKDLNLLGLLESIPASGIGEEVTELYPQLVKKNYGPNLKIQGDAKIIEVRYQTANFRGPTELMEFTFQEYVQMGRPRMLEVARDITDTFTKIDKMPEKFIGTEGF